MLRARCADDDKRKVSGKNAQIFDQLRAAHVPDARIDNGAVDVRKALEGLNRLLPAIGRDDVEFSGLNDEFAGGDAAGVFAVDNEKAGPVHPLIMNLRDGNAKA